MRIAALALASILTFAAPALAEPVGVRDACHKDLQNLCTGVQPGGGRIRDCMKQHRAELSITCKVAIADRMLERSGQHGARGEFRPAHSSPMPTSGPAVIKSVPQND